MNLRVLIELELTWSVTETGHILAEGCLWGDDLALMVDPVEGRDMSSCHALPSLPLSEWTWDDVMRAVRSLHWEMNTRLFPMLRDSYREHAMRQGHEVKPEETREAQHPRYQGLD